MIGARLDGPVVFRSSVELPDRILSATLRATAHGIYRACLNGARVGDELLSPGWTAYQHRLRFQVFDVTALVTQGVNALDLTVADGWWRGFLGWEGKRACYGTELAVLGELEVVHAGGTLRWGTDLTWRAFLGPVVSADLYQGEHHDARRQVRGEGHPVHSVACGHLEQQLSPPVRVTQVLEPVSLDHQKDRVIIDFGQNLVGRLRLSGLDLPVGTQVRLRHSEVLVDGQLCVGPLRTAAQTDVFVAAGTGEESWEPEFTFHGFRFAEVTGWPGVRAENLQARVLHTDLRRTGEFRCSDPLLNQLHANVVWGMRGNVVDVPTDCPQRDERLGWTGDLQVFAPTAAFLYDCRELLDSWLVDLALEQRPDGGVPEIVPSPPGAVTLSGNGFAAAWSDAAVIVPWVLYERYGDLDRLRRHLPSMQRYVQGLLAAHGPDLDPGMWQYGDWLDPDAAPDDSRGTKTSPFLIAGAYVVRDLDVLGAACEALGEADQAQHWLALAGHYRAVWHRHFVLGPGSLASDSAAAYSLAICFRLVDDAGWISAAGDRLRSLSIAAGSRITTGFVGTPLLLDALTLTGHLDEAYRVLLQTECPSFLYPVTMGATTVWERWDSLLPDGTVNSSGMTSFNHYALGAIADWLHRRVAGLAPLLPGYAELLVCPLPGGGLSSAEASLDTVHGTARVRWQLSSGLMTCEVESPVPVLVRLPTEGWQDLRLPAGTHVVRGLVALEPTC
ncbi:MAG: alpha-L-rhamnosidase [Frankiales bacterium]|nr:alpha-L-rhamnosidase [Frankiales bacterium]